LTVGQYNLSFDPNNTPPTRDELHQLFFAQTATQTFQRRLIGTDASKLDGHQFRGAQGGTISMAAHDEHRYRARQNGQMGNAQWTPNGVGRWRFSVLLYEQPFVPLQPINRRPLSISQD
jgi:hypothetical protein